VGHRKGGRCLPSKLTACTLGLASPRCATEICIWVHQCKRGALWHHLRFTRSVQARMNLTWTCGASDRKWRCCMPKTYLIQKTSLPVWQHLVHCPTSAARTSSQLIRQRSNCSLVLRLPPGVGPFLCRSLGRPSPSARSCPTPVPRLSHGVLSSLEAMTASS